MAGIPFKQLRLAMMEKEVTQAELAELLAKDSPSYLSKRMTAQMPFSATDIYVIAEFLEIPRERWVEVFFSDVVKAKRVCA